MISPEKLWVDIWITIRRGGMDRFPFNRIRDVLTSQNPRKMEVLSPAFMKLIMGENEEEDTLWFNPIEGKGNSD